MSSRVYVGNIPLDTRERELEDIFYKYGRIVSIDLKLPPRPPGFAFIQFEDARDAEEATRGRDGYDFHGSRLRVELAHGGARGGGGGGGDRGGSRYGDRGGDRYGGGGGGGGRQMGPSPFGPSRRTDYRVIVTGLPTTASWQDLKDHMRRAGDVTFAQVMRDGKGMLGLVDYAHRADMDTALRKLDDTEFRNPFDKCYIRVKQDKGDGPHGGGSRRSRSRSRSRDKRRSDRSRSRSRSASKSRSRSRSKSPADKSRSRSRSKSASPAKSASRSRSRSRSASPAKGRSPARSASPAKSG